MHNQSRPDVIRKSTLLLTLFIISFNSTLFAQATESSFLKDGELNLNKVVEYFEDLYRSDSSTSKATLTITRPRRTRVVKINSWTKGKKKALMIITHPVKEKGMATLKVDKNLWNYMPRINRTIRIPPSMMMASWMGTDMTNDDLVKETSFRDDYTFSLVGPSTKPKGWTILFTAKKGVVGLWKRFELVVSPDGKLPLTARYFDRKDRLARTIVWDQVKEFDGKRLPARMTLTPNDKEGHKTVMVYEELEFNVKIPERTFSLTNLERKR